MAVRGAEQAGSTVSRLFMTFRSAGTGGEPIQRQTRKGAPVVAARKSF